MIPFFSYLNRQSNKKKVMEKVWIPWMGEKKVQKQVVGQTPSPLPVAHPQPQSDNWHACI